MIKVSKRSPLIVFIVISLLVGAAAPAWAKHILHEKNETPIGEVYSKVETVPQAISDALDASVSTSGSQPHSVAAATYGLSPVAVTEAVYGADSLEAIKRLAAENRMNRLYQQDRFNYQQEDVEEFLLNGYTLEDIYMSDLIGNQWLVNPRELMEQKKSTGVEWKAIAREKQAQVEGELESLLSQYPLKERKLRQTAGTAAEKLELLKHLDEDYPASWDAAITAYRKQGQDGLTIFNLQREEGEYE